LGPALLKGLVTIGLLAALTFALPAHAQSPTTVDVTQVIAGAYPDVTAVVTVRDATGAPVGGLSASNFSASEEANPVDVTSVQAAVDADVGLAVVLVMDTSGSMAGTPLSLAEDAAVSFVDSLLPKDGAIVIPFADNVGAPSPLTADKQALAATLRGLRAGGSTALYDAVVAAAQSAKSAPLPRKVVVLLTDGQESGNRSAADVEGSLSAAVGSAAPFFTIGLGSDINVLYLQALAGRTGGEFLAAPAPTDIPSVYDHIGIMLRSQYLVRLQLSAPADGGTSDLTLTVNAGGASASGSARLVRPGVAPSATPRQAPEAVTGTTSGSGGGPSPAVFALVGASAVLLLGGGAVGVRRMRRNRTAAEESGATTSSRSYTPPPVAGWQGESPPTARLLVVDGPDKGKNVPLGDQAVTLGADADCALTLANPDGRVGGHHARIWLREGHFMLHHLEGAAFATNVGERQVAWAVLEDGDEVVIGPHRLLFEYLPASGR
jgi:VWFA-related protein